MSRLIWIMMLAGLLVPIGCEQKPADRTPGKVTSEDVRRDADKAAPTEAERFQEAKEESPKKPEARSTDRTPGKVTSEDVRRDAGKAVETVSEYSQQVRDVFQKKLENQINELDGKIIQLRAKGRKLNDKAKADWDQKIAELEVKLDAARAKLAKLGQSSADAWDDAQRGAESAYDDLDKAFRDASKEF